MKETLIPRVVPFEVAKLLKEVGYDEKIKEFWAYADPFTAKGGVRVGGTYSNHFGSYVPYSNSEWVKSDVEFAKAFGLDNKHPAISAPSYDMVIDWILEHLGVYVSVLMAGEGMFIWKVVLLNGGDIPYKKDSRVFSTRYEAMDAVFLHILKARKKEMKKEEYERIKKKFEDGLKKND